MTRVFLVFLCHFEADPLDAPVLDLILVHFLRRGQGRGLGGLVGRGLTLLGLGGLRDGGEEAAYTESGQGRDMHLSLSLIHKHTFSLSLSLS